MNNVAKKNVSITTLENFCLLFLRYQPGHEIRFADIYDKYFQHCETTGKDPATRIAFNKYILQHMSQHRTRPVEKKHKNDGLYLVNLDYSDDFEGFIQHPTDLTEAFLLFYEKQLTNLQIKGASKEEIACCETKIQELQRQKQLKPYLDEIDKKIHQKRTQGEQERETQGSL